MLLSFMYYLLINLACLMIASEPCSLHCFIKIEFALASDINKLQKVKCMLKLSTLKKRGEQGEKLTLVLSNPIVIPKHQLLLHRNLEYYYNSTSITVMINGSNYINLKQRQEKQWEKKKYIFKLIQSRKQEIIETSWYIPQASISLQKETPFLNLSKQWPRFQWLGH